MGRIVDWSRIGYRFGREGCLRCTEDCLLVFSRPGCELLDQDVRRVVRETGCDCMKVKCL